MLPTGQLIAIVLAVVALEVAVLLLLAALPGTRRALGRRMLPGAAAGLFLALALRELHAGGPLLALWLAGSGVAHALDWRQRARR